MALAALKYGVWQVEPHIEQAVGIASLRGWLHGSWGLLFSHADDFASYGFEADRWLCACAAERRRAPALRSFAGARAYLVQCHRLRDDTLRHDRR